MTFPFALSLSKGRSWFDELTTNGNMQQRPLLSFLRKQESKLGVGWVQRSETHHHTRQARATALGRPYWPSFPLSSMGQALRKQESKLS